MMGIQISAGDAALIAAAPELLTELEKANAALCGEFCSHSGACSAMNANCSGQDVFLLIARAKGEQP